MLKKVLQVVFVTRIMFLLSWRSAVEVIGGWTKRGMRVYPEFLASLLNGRRRGETIGKLAGMSVLTSDATGAAQEAMAAVGAEFLSTLRALVDQWIESGRPQREGGENPWERSVRVSTQRYPRPIIDTLRNYHARNPPTVLLMGDGRFGVTSDPRRAWPLPELKPETMLARARDFAISEFVMLLDSPSRERLFKCDGCGTYFVRLRAPKKDVPIKKGTFCEKCKSAGGARRMGDTRRDKKLEMLKVAADAWGKWRYSHRHPDQREWVAREVNKRCGTKIRRKWVSQNLQKVLECVEALNNAKG